MFTEEEKYLLNKLLHKVKYSELDAYELNQFANSPITNTRIELSMWVQAGRLHELW